MTGYTSSRRASPGASSTMSIRQRYAGLVVERALHALGLVELAVELDGSRRGRQRHGHRGGFARLNRLIDLQRVDREVVRHVAFVLHRDGDVRALVGLEERRVEVEVVL